MDGKATVESLTVWINLAVGALVVVVTYLLGDETIKQNPDLVKWLGVALLVLNNVSNILIRIFKTSQPITKLL